MLDPINAEHEHLVFEIETACRPRWLLPSARRFLSPSSPPAPAMAAADDLDRAVAALRGISTMKADFVQTDRSGQTMAGQMTLKRPGKIRFEYEKGVPMLIVSNGKSMYMVDYEVSQVQRWPISNSPLGALLDPSRDVKRYGKLVPTGHPDVVSVEVRDPKRPEFGVITLIFALATPRPPAGCG